MNPVSVALLNLQARPTRTLLLSILVALALATALTLMVLSQSIGKGIREGYDERGADLTVAQRDASELLSGSVPQPLEGAIRGIKGVTAISGELVMFAPLEGGRQSVLVGWTQDAYFWGALPIQVGRGPVAGDQRPAILGTGIAAALKKEVGDTLEIFGEPFHVVGISGFASALNRNLIVLRLADLQEIALRQNQVTAFHIVLENGLGAAALERIKEEIEGLGRLVVTPTEQLLRTDRNYIFLQAVSRAISIIALAMGSLSIFSALLMAVHERRREIGVMMAVGWSNGKIRTSVVVEAILIGLSGGLFAIPLVWLAALLFKRLPGIGDVLTLELSPDLFGLGLLGSVLVGVAGSLYPAVRATWMSPSQALRFS
jgi:putative ABC transport system permease protein